MFFRQSARARATCVCVQRGECLCVSESVLVSVYVCVCVSECVYDALVYVYIIYNGLEFSEGHPESVIGLLTLLDSSHHLS